MANKILIQSVVQKKSSKINERIISIGGLDNGMPWQLEQLAAVSAIENNKFSFYMKFFGTVIDVKVSSYNGSKYLSTVEDVGDLHLLLSLPNKNPKI